MYETYGAKDVTLNVRVSNVAALALYKDTLGFTQSGIDAAYYGDKENAYTMKKSLDYLRHEKEDDVAEIVSGGIDEGDAVGSLGKAHAGTGSDKESAIRNVRIGKHVGVADLVERNEAGSAA